jgi:hypothetical protein
MHPTKPLARGGGHCFNRMFLPASRVFLNKCCCVYLLGMQQASPATHFRSMLCCMSVTPMPSSWPFTKLCTEASVVHRRRQSPDSGPAVGASCCASLLLLLLAPGACCCFSCCTSCRTYRQHKKDSGVVSAWWEAHLHTQSAVRAACWSLLLTEVLHTLPLHASCPMQTSCSTTDCCRISGAALLDCRRT